MLVSVRGIEIKVKHKRVAKHAFFSTLPGKMTYDHEKLSLEDEMLLISHVSTQTLSPHFYSLSLSLFSLFHAHIHKRTIYCMHGKQIHKINFSSL